MRSGVLGRVELYHLNQPHITLPLITTTTIVTNHQHSTFFQDNEKFGQNTHDQTRHSRRSGSEILGLKFLAACLSILTSVHHELFGRRRRIFVSNSGNGGQVIPDLCQLFVLVVTVTVRHVYILQDFS